MKKFALVLAAVFVFAMACGREVTPEHVVQRLIEALSNRNGDGVVSCMSSEDLAEVGMFIELMRVSPDESVAQLALLSLEFTPEEVADLTAGQFFTAILNSELFIDERLDFSNVEIGDAVIDGDNAMVPVIIDGNTEKIELILENGNWKIDEGIDFM